MAYPLLDPHAYEPDIADLAELRAHRKTRLALAYRVFGALRWGALGDGHISARDSERADHFWLAGYGVPFNSVTVDDLVLVGPEGTVVDGRGGINQAAHNIHWPIHEARPDIVSAAHTHTPYGTPFSALVTKLRPITQEACAFYDDHEIFDDEEVDIVSTDGGKRIGVALGDAKAVILRNHGLLTVGQTVDECVGFYVMMERTAEAHMKAPNGKAIGHEAASQAYLAVGTHLAGWHYFQWLLRTYVPDPTVVG
ncbi:MAG: ribulose phosphate epimerase [Ilumatobacteraceae bacterium]|nr:ribulose phosphate epimerase [Ilumatobacteraceae bacterium]